MGVNFDFSNPITPLRILCGAFLIPHAVGKFTAQEASFGFFRAAGFKPPAPFAFLAMGIEVILGVLLLLGLFTHLAGWAACIYLLIAGAAVAKVAKKWLWHIGGCEYPIFWAICCAVVGAYSA